MADEGTGSSSPTAQSPGDVVALFLETTRVVGTVDPDGLLTGGGLLHPDQGTLARTLVLSIRAEIAGRRQRHLGQRAQRRGLPPPGHHRSAGGPLGSLDGRLWDRLAGPSGWTSPRVAVRLPADPCPGQDPDGVVWPRSPVPRPNEISFVFTGDPEVFPSGVTFEVDWMTLEPKDQPGLAWRPVLLVHGLDASSASMQPGTAWVDGLQARDVASYAVNLTPKGSIFNNGAELAPAVADLRRRFGVDRVHLLGHSKGGIDAREYVRRPRRRRHPDHAGRAERGQLHGRFRGTAFAFPHGARSLGTSRARLEMTTPSMRTYNFFTVANPETTYVTAAGDRDGSWANKMAVLFGANDDVVSVSSVGCLPYAQAHIYRSSDSFTDHFGMRFNTGVVDDLFPAYIAVLTPPSAAAAAARGRGLEAEAAGTQTLMSGAGIADSGVTTPYAAVLDAVAAAVFVMLGDQDGLRFELVSPAGGQDRRGDPGGRPGGHRHLATGTKGRCRMPATTSRRPRPAAGRSRSPAPASRRRTGASTPWPCSHRARPGSG